MAGSTTKILIAGDSFAAPYPRAKSGWPNLIADQFKTTNIAQAGVSEYKILKQIQSINLNQYDLIIISHTSPSRVHIKKHPIHTTDLHKNCDLIYTDIAEKNHWFNKQVLAAKLFFKHIYDDEYQTDLYNLLRKEINSLIHIPYISLGHVPIVSKFQIEENFLDFSSIWPLYKGDTNHYNNEGNLVVYESVIKEIERVLSR